MSQFWKACSHCPLEKPIYDQTFNLLANVLRYCLPPVECLSASCCKAAPQHGAANPVFYDCDGVLQTASLIIFSFIHNNGHYGQTVQFLFLAEQPFMVQYNFKRLENSQRINQTCGSPVFFFFFGCDSFLLNLS